MTEKERLISELAGLLSDRSADDIKRIIQLVKDYISLVDENRNSPEKSSGEISLYFGKEFRFLRVEFLV